MPAASKIKLDLRWSPLEIQCIRNTCKKYCESWQDSAMLADVLVKNYQVSYRHQREGGDFTIATLFRPRRLLEQEALPPRGGVYVGATKLHHGGPRFKVPAACSACFRWEELLKANPVPEKDTYSSLQGRLVALSRAVRNYIDWNDREMFEYIDDDDE
jgi:hypothetical protein